MAEQAKPVDILLKAKEYLSEKSRWTKYMLYKDACGDQCVLSEASCACLVGALNIVSPISEAQTEAKYALRRSLRHPYLSLMSFNDDTITTHQDVLNLFDRAIKRLSSGVTK